MPALVSLLMAGVRVERHRATVEVHPDHWGDYTAGSIQHLEAAVLAACRAIDTAEARDLAARVAGGPR